MISPLESPHQIALGCPRRASIVRKNGGLEDTEPARNESETARIEPESATLTQHVAIIKGSGRFRKRPLYTPASIESHSHELRSTLKQVLIDSLPQLHRMVPVKSLPMELADVQVPHTTSVKDKSQQGVSLWDKLRRGTLQNKSATSSSQWDMLYDMIRRRRGSGTCLVAINFAPAALASDGAVENSLGGSSMKDNFKDIRSAEIRYLPGVGQRFVRRNKLGTAALVDSSPPCRLGLHRSLSERACWVDGAPYLTRQVFTSIWPLAKPRQANHLDL